MSIVTALLGALGVIAAVFSAVMVWIANKRKELTPKVEAILVGAITNFLDTLGIGSFATTTAWLRFRKLIPDSFLPPTLNAGHALPTVVQGFIFIKLIEVDPKLLVACIVAAVAGSVLGAPIVVRLPQRSIQAAMGVALVIAAALYVAKNLAWIPDHPGGLSLSGTMFAVAVAGHFVLGALMSLGIGLYAPSLMLLSFLGLDTRAVFPIMAGACAFLMPISGVPFVMSKRIDVRVVLGIAIGGIPAVLLAALLVWKLPINELRWIVAAVVLYTGVTLLYAAARGKAAPASSDA